MQTVVLRAGVLVRNLGGAKEGLSRLDYKFFLAVGR
jgi:hypothetical protein